MGPPCSSEVLSVGDRHLLKHEVEQLSTRLIFCVTVSLELLGCSLLPCLCEELPLKTRVRWACRDRPVNLESPVALLEGSLLCIEVVLDATSIYEIRHG